MSELTRILDGMERQEPEAPQELLSLVYEELRKLAAHKLAAEKPGQTIQATALVHEAWIRLAGSEHQLWKGRDHFFGAAAEAMRRILVDNARRKLRLRHGGGWERVELDGLDLPVAAMDDKCLRVSEYLDLLAADDPEKAEVVKLRVFAGLKVSEIAVALNCSEKTVQRHWNFAKAWLSRSLRESG